MKPNKPAQPSKVQEPRERFRLRKLEERIAPKGPKFTNRHFCASF